MSRLDTEDGIKKFSEKLRLVFGKDTFTEEEMDKEFYTTLYISCNEFFRSDNKLMDLDLFWSESVRSYLLEPKVDGIPIAWENP